MRKALQEHLRKRNSNYSTNILSVTGAENLTAFLSGVILDAFEKVKEQVCAEKSTEFVSVFRADPICGEYVGRVVCSSAVT